MNVLTVIQLKIGAHLLGCGYKIKYLLQGVDLFQGERCIDHTGFTSQRDQFNAERVHKRVAAMTVCQKAVQLLLLGQIQIGGHLFGVLLQCRKVPVAVQCQLVHIPQLIVLGKSLVEEEYHGILIQRICNITQRNVHRAVVVCRFIVRFTPPTLGEIHIGQLGQVSARALKCQGKQYAGMSRNQIVFTGCARQIVSHAGDEDLTVPPVPHAGLDLDLHITACFHVCVAVVHSLLQEGCIAGTVPLKLVIGLLTGEDRVSILFKVVVCIKVVTGVRVSILLLGSLGHHLNGVLGYIVLFTANEHAKTTNKCQQKTENLRASVHKNAPLH